MIWVYLHILTMFAAVGVAFGSEIVLRRTAGTGDVRSIRTAFGLATTLEADHTRAAHPWGHLRVDCGIGEQLRFFRVVAGPVIRVLRNRVRTWRSYPGPLDREGPSGGRVEPGRPPV